MAEPCEAFSQGLPTPSRLAAYSAASHLPRPAGRWRMPVEESQTRTLDMTDHYLRQQADLNPDGIFPGDQGWQLSYGEVDGLVRAGPATWATGRADKSSFGPRIDVEIRGRDSWRWLEPEPPRWPSHRICRTNSARRVEAAARILAPADRSCLPAGARGPPKVFA